MTKQRIYTDLIAIELTGHKGCGAEIECEVQFTRTPVVPAQLSGPPEYCHPEEGGETEIVRVTPLRDVSVGLAGAGARKFYEPHECPRWLEDLLIECIDPSELTAEEDADDE